jgi:hypothetical protein
VFGRDLRDLCDCIYGNSVCANSNPSKTKTSKRNMKAWIMLNEHHSSTITTNIIQTESTREHRPALKNKQTEVQSCGCPVLALQQLGITAQLVMQTKL